jgi:hypothetical protein
MPTEPPRLYDLLAPQFLAGFTFPSHVDSYLSVLAVRDLRTAEDEFGVLYTGTLRFGKDGEAVPDLTHQDPASGAVFRWEDVTVEFRLTLPRDGARFIDQGFSAVAALPEPDASVTDLKAAVAEVDALFDALGLAEDPATGASEYPGIRFRLELLVTALTFHMPGEHWVPGEVGPDRRVVRKTPAAGEPDDVRFLLPKMVLIYEQEDDFTRPPSFRVGSWGSSGFDAATDLRQGELARMDPPLALHTSGRFAFGVDQVLLDLSPDHTPPEILAFFGTDEGFEGIFVKSARVFYDDKDKDFAINVGVNDVLVSFAGEVSLEAAVDFLGAATTFKVRVRLFQGAEEIDYTDGAPVQGNPLEVAGGLATVDEGAVVQVEITGGVPPIDVSVKLGVVPVEIFVQTDNQAVIPPGALNQVPLEITVTDSGTPDHVYHEIITLTVRAKEPAAETGLAADRDEKAEAGRKPAALTIQSDQAPQFTLSHSPAPTGHSEVVSIIGPLNPPPAVKVGGNPFGLFGGEIRLEVPDGTSIPIEVTFQPQPQGVAQTFDLFFNKDDPDETGNRSVDEYVAGHVTGDARFTGSHSPDGQTLADWCKRLVANSQAAVEAYASFDPSNETHDQELSGRRGDVARQLVERFRQQVTVTVAAPSAHGHFNHPDGTLNTSAQNPNGTPNPNFNKVENQSNPPDLDHFRVARITGTIAGPTPQPVVVTGTISRPQPDPPTGGGGGGQDDEEKKGKTPSPQPKAKEPPGVFRRLSFRIRLERNVPVLVEVSGELDLETDLEKSLRNGPAPNDPNVPADFNQQSLGLTSQPGANAPTNANSNPQDGVVDFLVNVTWDTSTFSLTETLRLGASPNDTDGLLQMPNPHQGTALTTENRFKDAFGAVLMLAPIINVAASSLDPASAGDWAVLGVSLGLPITLGGLGVLRTERAILFGGELKFRQFVPPNEAATFTDAGIIFDYAVDFTVNIEQLGISSDPDKPCRVRYRAVGFKLSFGDPITYSPIFDPSQGYELNLSDPGLFKLPQPLDSILKILGARLARFNPLTLELDLGMKVDLGVVRVDRFKVKWPLDPLGVPSILPSAATIEVPGVLIGSGAINITQPPADPPPGATTGGGFEGTLDVTLVPSKLRICASLGVQDVQKDGRRAIAVFAGLIVDFPAPLPLGQSGIGLYGLSGLFAMHYKRLEPVPPPGSAVGPALLWLADVAKGEPAKLLRGAEVVEPPYVIINADGGTVSTWGPEIDAWSFGVGAVLGTMEGGFVAQLRGMLVLELPGPRVLIFTKLTVISLPGAGLVPSDALKVGMLGVLDLDFNLGRVTVGVIVDLEVKEVIRIRVPVELFFNLRDATDWHYFIGTFQDKVTARILGIVDGYGYFMVSGKTIEDWPGREPLRDLPGLAVATGLSASILLGDEDIGLYLRAAAGFDAGVSFAPFFVVGDAFLDGELRLFVVSLEAKGNLHLEAPDPTFIEGEVCASVDLFFYTLEGCVGLSIGDSERSLPAPELVRNVFLQSHAPVLTAGQAENRPIDASLGDAPRVGSSAPILENVPIDSVPVIQFHAAPDVSGAATFTEALVTPPGATPGFELDVGGGRKVKYVLKEIALASPVALPAGAAKPPATWRADVTAPSGGAKTNIDLALMSRVPMHGERAIERSSDLHEIVTTRWADLCTPVAPPACVLYTFCGQPLGPSGRGWQLEGAPSEDPPGTTRGTPPPTTLVVEESPTGPLDQLIGLTAEAAGLRTGLPAQVIGRPGKITEDGGDGSRPRVECIIFSKKKPASLKNPFTENGLGFAVGDRLGGPAREARITALDGQTGLDLGARTEIKLTQPTRAASLFILAVSERVRVSGFDSAGAKVADAVVEPGRRPDEVKLNARGGIARIVLEAAKSGLLLRICVEPQPHRPELRPPAITGKPRLDRLAQRFFDRERLQEKFAVQRPPQSSFAGRLRLGPLTLAERARAAALDEECFRALQPGQHLKRPGIPEFKPDRSLTDQLEKRRRNDFITLDFRGPAAQVLLFLAVDKEVAAAGALIFRQLDAKGNTLAETDLAAADKQSVTNVTDGLPNDWLEPPWRDEVLPAATFLASSAFTRLTRFLVRLKLKPDCVKLQLRLTRTFDLAPACLLSVVEVCPASESVRAKTEEASRQGELTDLLGYLNGDADVPLLAPNTLYTLTVRYDAISTEADGTQSTEPGISRAFQFKTDAAPPKRLNPWVLATTPDDETRDVFFHDPIKVVFNDTAVLQLVKTYGKQLRAKLRRADGIAIPDQIVQTLDPVPADLTSPLREFIESMVAAGLLPCAGEIQTPVHGSATLPLPLEPLMAYTLDLEFDPPVPAADPAKPPTPVFRRQFTTGRFASLAALAADTGGRRIVHRALTAGIALPGAGPVTTVTDIELESALKAAGDKPRAAADEPVTTIFWAPTAGGFAPHALLMDAPESLWRRCASPRLEVVPHQNDPAFERIVPGDAESLRVVESGTSVVVRFIRTVAGARTLVMLGANAAGGQVKLTLERPTNDLLQLPQQSAPLLNVTFATEAPWEEEA